jgi:hypothetical protein
VLQQLKSSTAAIMGPAFSEQLPEPPSDLEGPALAHEAERIEQWHDLVRLAVDRRAEFARAATREAAPTHAVPRETSLPEVQSLVYAFALQRIVQYPDQRPVFVLGAARSGTSAMAKALLQGAGFFGWHEGHLFSYLPAMLRAVRVMWELFRIFQGTAPIELYAFGKMDVYELINQIVSSHNKLYTDAMLSAGKERWLDKTPSLLAVMAVPLLNHIYPGASFIYMHRHPIKLALSRAKKFPDQTPEMALLDWIITMRSWSAVRESLGPSSYLEVEQAELTTGRQAVASQLAKLLDLNEHQSAAVGSYLQHERPESTGSSQDADEILLEDVDWAPVLKHFCLTLCEDTARQWGYRLRRHGPDVATCS